MRRLGIAVLLVALLGAAAAALLRGRTDTEYGRLIEAGERALGQGESYAAIESFSGALAFRPDSMLAHLRRGEAYQQQQSFGAAVRDLTMAARLDPNAAQPLERLGQVYADRGEFARSADWYAQASERDPPNPTLAYHAGYGRYLAGQAAHAVQLLRRAIQHDPDSAPAHHALGLALRDTGDSDGALASLDRAVTLAPTLLPAREALADLHTRRGDAVEALRHLETLAALDPTVSRHIAVALAAAEGGRTDRAVLALASANDIVHNDPRLHLALGRVWLLEAERQGDRAALRKAAEALKRASATLETSETFALVGRLAYLSGSRGEAGRLLARAIDERPLWPEALRFYADSLRSAGRSADAEVALAQYARLRTRE